MKAMLFDCPKQSYILRAIYVCVCVLLGVGRRVVGVGVLRVIYSAV